MNVGPGRFQALVAREDRRADTRKLALDCMLRALQYPDENREISPVVGSHLQLAVDRLSAAMSKS